MPETVRLAELVREQVLRRTRQELPHAVEVEVPELEHARTGCSWSAPRCGPRATPRRRSSWAGRTHDQGDRTAARREIEKSRGERMHLELQVRVRRGWRRDEGLLDRLGIE